MLIKNNIKTILYARFKTNLKTILKSLASFVLSCRYISTYIITGLAIIALHSLTKIVWNIIIQITEQTQ